MTIAPTAIVKPEQQKLFEDFKTAAEIVDAPFDEAVVSKMFNAYSQFFVSEPTTTSLMMRIDTKNTNRIAMRYTDFEVPHDPFLMALDAGLIEQTDHPMMDLVPQIQEKADILGYGIDFTSSLGFEKIWPYFNPVSIDDFHAMPAVPQASRDMLDFYHKHGLQWVSILGVDYPARTMNIYFFQKTPGHYSPEDIAQMLTDVGIEPPSDEELQICSNAPISYLTFSWDKPGVQRYCICAPYPKEAVPDYSPVINKFVANAPRITEQGGYMFCGTYSKDNEPFYKMEVDYAGLIGPLLGILLGTLK